MLSLRTVLPALALAGLALGGATACSSEGTETQCSTSACTVTFDRGVDAEVSILGIQAELVRVDGDRATLKVGGHKVVVPVGGESEAEGMNVSLEELTQEHVTVRITMGDGG